MAFSVFNFQFSGFCFYFLLSSDPSRRAEHKLYTSNQQAGNSPANKQSYLPVLSIFQPRVWAGRKETQHCMTERRNTGWTLRASWASGLGLGMTGFERFIHGWFRSGFSAFSFFSCSSDWFVGDGWLSSCTPCLLATDGFVSSRGIPTGHLVFVVLVFFGTHALARWPWMVDILIWLGCRIAAHVCG